MDLIKSLSETERWGYGLVATAIVVAVLAPLVTHRLTARRDRQTARRNAGTHFRVAVLTALNGLYPLPFNWPNDINQSLKNVGPTLQAAVAEFRPFVRWWHRRAFDRAWFKYRSGTGRNKDLQWYHHYTAFDDNPDAKEVFRRNVDKLLSFVK